MKQQLAQELLRQLDKTSPEYATAVKLIEAMNHKPSNTHYVLSKSIEKKFGKAIYWLHRNHKDKYRIIRKVREIDMYSRDGYEYEYISIQDRQTKNIKRYYFSKEI